MGDDVSQHPGYIVIKRNVVIESASEFVFASLLLVSTVRPHVVEYTAEKRKHRGKSSRTLHCAYRDRFERNSFKFASLIDMTWMYFWSAETKKKLDQVKNEANRRKQNETKKKKK